MSGAIAASTGTGSTHLTAGFSIHSTTAAPEIAGTGKTVSYELPGPSPHGARAAAWTVGAACIEGLNAALLLLEAAAGSGDHDPIVHGGGADGAGPLRTHHLGEAA